MQSTKARLALASKRTTNRTSSSWHRELLSGARPILLFAFVLPWLDTAIAQPYSYERSFGTVGTGPGQFQQITALAQDSHGDYVILDGTAGEFQVCSSLGICTEHDTLAKAENLVGFQQGLAVNSMDEIFITDQNGRVEKCTHDGSCETFLTEYGGDPVYPWGIAIDQQDRIYIADQNGSRIIVCESGGSCSSFGGWGSEPGQFNGPYGLAINSREQVLVTDAGNLRLQACDHMGNCEVAGYDYTNFYYFGPSGQGIALLPSDTMVSTGYGYVHVSACAPDGACTTISKYENDGPDYIQEPKAIMVNSDGRLVVGDYGSVHFLAPHVTINPGINDAWIEVGIPGQGLLVSVFESPPTVFIAWFTYEHTRPSGLPDAEIGEWGHRWVTLQGGYSGNVANLDIYLTEGGVFEGASPPPDDAKKIGEASLTLHDCYYATLDYSITGTNFQGTKELVRIVNDNVPKCELLSGRE